VLKIFFAQPVDFVDEDYLNRNFEKFRNSLIDLEVEIIAPYLSQSRLLIVKEFDSQKATSVVSSNLAELGQCDVLILDMSDPRRQYIGMIFEMAFAFINNKIIIVFTDSSQIKKRTFIYGTANYICSSLEDLRKYIAHILSSLHDPNGNRS